MMNNEEDIGGGGKAKKEYNADVLCNGIVLLCASIF